MAREIQVTIDDLGQTKFVGQGFTGRTCDQFMEPLEKALAGDGEVKKEYDERWAKNEQKERVVQRW